MNILVAHNHYQIAGGEDTVFERETRLLEEYGHRVLRYERSNTELNDHGVAAKLLAPAEMIWSERTAEDVRRIIRMNGIDVVHVHNTLLRMSPSIYYAALNEGIPVVQTIHNFRLVCPAGICYRNGRICEDCLNHGLHCALKHSCYRGSKAQTLASVLMSQFHRATGIYKKLHYICLTEFNRDILLRQGQIRPEQIFVKPNSADDPGTPTPYEARKDQILFAGRLDESKGIRFLLETWKRMKTHPFQLLIAGSGPLEEECRAMIRQTEMTDAVMLGTLSHEAVLAVMKESKALVLPTEWYEGLPMSLVEAMSCGTPVIVPAMGNAGNMVIEGVNGYTYEPKNPRSLQEAFQKPLNLQNAVYGVFRENYTDNANLAALEDIYQKVKGTVK